MQKGLDFYSRLVDELKAAGIEPFATLYHWDLPQAPQDKYGGWQSAETAKAFGEYGGHVAKSLGDRVTNFFTINEFRQVAEMGHRGVELQIQGTPVRMHIAPGLTLEDGPLNQVRHHTILGHGLAVQGMRASGRPGMKIGPAENMPHALPVMDSPEHVRAAETATRTLNRYFMGPMPEGRYDDEYLKSAGKDAPKFTAEEMKSVGSPLDFVGINVYIPSTLVMASDGPSGYREVPFNVSHPKMFSSWHRLAPESQHWSPRLLHSLWKPKEIYITENGCAASDVVAADGNVYDSRLKYLRNAMMEPAGHVGRNSAEGQFLLECDGQFRVDGRLRHALRPGVCGLQDPETPPELSAQWFREAARRNTVV